MNYHPQGVDIPNINTYFFRASQRYFSTGITGTGVFASSRALNILFAYPFIVSGDETFDSIGVNVTTSGAGSTRLGIYKNQEGRNAYPGPLILDAGTVAINTNGVKEIAINTLLTKGLYWLVHVQNVTASFTTAGGVPSSVQILGAATVGANAGIDVDIAFVFAALPDPFPAGGTFGGSGGIVFLRKL